MIYRTIVSLVLLLGSTPKRQDIKQYSVDGDITSLLIDDMHLTSGMSIYISVIGMYIRINSNEPANHRLVSKLFCNPAEIPVRVLPFLNNPKDLDPSYKMDLDIWNSFGKNKVRLVTDEMR